MAVSGRGSKEIIVLDNALKQLVVLDKRKARVAKMKFFGGLTAEEIAEVLKVLPETIKRDWRFGRRRLLHELSDTD